MTHLTIHTDNNIEVTLRTNNDGGYGYDVQSANESGIVHIEKIPSTEPTPETSFGQKIPQTFRITGKKPGTCMFKSVRPFDKTGHVADEIRITVT